MRSRAHHCTVRSFFQDWLAHTGSLLGQDYAQCARFIEVRSRQYLAELAADSLENTFSRSGAAPARRSSIQAVAAATIQPVTLMTFSTTLVPAPGAVPERRRPRERRA
eukprot:m.67562 g.67562  ORF g.67562 m.67562 type:complete len:108 (-) comp7457_c0_seq2:60-383(-)